jgi:two-component system KDP operon response regulator KdpE
MSEVVLADADGHERARAAAALRFGGYRVRAARSVAHAATLLRRPDLAAIVVDPVGSPAVVVADLRARTTVPIIVVSARADERDKVSALDAGADDYLTKPFGAEELLARLRAVLRRVLPPHPDDVEPIVTPDFTLLLSDKRAVDAGGADVHLTRVEWRIVALLAARAGHLVPHEDLLLGVWGPNALEKPGNIRVNMAHIRAKLEPEPSAPRYFVTAPGLGVRFDPAGGAS